MQRAGYIPASLLKSPSIPYTPDDTHKIPILSLKTKKPTSQTLSLPRVQNPHFYAVELNDKFLVINPTTTQYTKKDIVLIEKDKTHTVSNYKKFPNNTTILGKIIWTISPT